MSERFEESDTSKKLERSPAYHIAKDIGKAGLSAAVTVYDGLEEALTILGKSSAEATVDLIDHKYGSQAGNASEEATFWPTSEECIKKSKKLLSRIWQKSL